MAHIEATCIGDNNLVSATLRDAARIVGEGGVADSAFRTRIEAEYAQYKADIEKATAAQVKRLTEPY